METNLQDNEFSNRGEICEGFINNLLQIISFMRSEISNPAVFCWECGEDNEVW